MNICIPLGGLETRVRAFWEGPKCLIPVGGRPLLERLWETNHDPRSSLVANLVESTRDKLGDDAWILASGDRRGYWVELRRDSTPARLKLPHPRYRGRKRK